jgi:hypothetical protein
LLHSTSTDNNITFHLATSSFFFRRERKMISRAHCSMAPQARGCPKGAYSKATRKQDSSKSLLDNITWPVLKSRARNTPAPGPGFSVSLETEKRFVVAVCHMLVWYSIKEASSNNIISYEEMWLQVRKASLTAELAQPVCCTYSSML